VEVGTGVNVGVRVLVTVAVADGKYRSDSDCRSGLNEVKARTNRTQIPRKDAPTAVNANARGVEVALFAGWPRN
jgi:hypothetical protein